MTSNDDVPGARADPTSPQADSSYALWPRFLKLILPPLALLAVTLVGVVAYGTRSAIQEVYLELAQRRAAVVAEAIQRSAPRAWEALLTAPSAPAFYRRPEGQGLARTIAAKARELEPGRFRIHARDGTVLYAADSEIIGRREAPQTVALVVKDNDAVLMEGTDPRSGEDFRLFVPLDDGKGGVSAVAEITEPADFLEGAILRNVVLPVAAPALLLLGMILALTVVVLRAQRHIDDRTAQLVALRRRLEHFVSQGTVFAASREAEAGVETAARIRSTLLFVDVRGFTGLAQSAPPEAVARFLSSIVNVVVRIVQAHGGDVDKLIGDGALVRFEGEARRQSAVAAARQIIREIEVLHPSRGVGIGIADGDVISTVIGSAGRRDFTVIGDSVNLAARLCALAARGEIVVELSVLAGLDATAEGFGPPETTAIKGRSGLVTIRRCTSSTAEGELAGP